MSNSKFYLVGDDLYDLDKYYALLRGHRNNYANFLMTSKNIPQEDTARVLREIDTLGNLFYNSQNPLFSPMGNFPIARSQGMAGPDYITVEHKLRGKNPKYTYDVYSLAEDYFRSILNLMQKETPTEKPIAEYIIKLPELTKTEPKATTTPVTPAKVTTTPVEKKIETPAAGEDPNDKSKIPNPFIKGDTKSYSGSQLLWLNGMLPDINKEALSDESLNQSLVAILNRLWDDPESDWHKNHLAKYYPSIEYKGLMEQGMDDLKGWLTGKPITDPSMRDFWVEQVLGQELFKDEYAGTTRNKKFFKEGDDVPMSNQIKNRYDAFMKKILPNMHQKIKERETSDMIALRLMTGSRGLTDAEKGDLNYDPAFIKSKEYPNGYWVIPGQLIPEKNNSQSLWVVLIDPKTSEMKYSQMNLGTIIDDMKSDPTFSKKDVEGCVNKLVKTYFDSTKPSAYDGIVNQHKFGGTIENAKKFLKYGFGGYMQSSSEKNPTAYEAAGYKDDYDVNKHKYLNKNYASELDPLAGIEEEDILRMLGATLDFASVGLNIAGFTPASAVAGVAGTAVTAGADFTDDSVSKWEAIKNTGINLGLDAISLIPEFGASTKLAKKAASFSKYTALLGTVAAAYAAPEQLPSIQKIINNEPLTREDYVNVANFATNLLGIGGGAIKKGMRKVNPTGSYSARSDMKGLRVIDKNGQKQHIILEGEALNKAQTLKTPEEFNALLNELYPLAGFTVPKDFTTTWGDGLKFWKKKEEFLSPLRDIYEKPDGTAFIQGNGTDTDVVINIHKAGDPKYDAKGNPILIKEGDPVVDSYGNPVKNSDGEILTYQKGDAAIGTPAKYTLQEINNFDAQILSIAGFKTKAGPYASRDWNKALRATRISDPRSNEADVAALNESTVAGVKKKILERYKKRSEKAKESSDKNKQLIEDAANQSTAEANQSISTKHSEKVKVQEDLDEQIKSIRKELNESFFGRVHADGSIKFRGKNYSYDEFKEFVNEMRAFRGVEPVDPSIDPKRLRKLAINEIGELRKKGIKHSKKEASDKTSSIDNEIEGLEKSKQDIQTKKEEDLKKVKETYEKALEKYKDRALKLAKYFSENPSFLKKDITTTIYINGTPYEINHSLLPNIMSTEDIYNKLKIDFDKSGGNIDFKKCQKFINKYGVF